MDDDERTCSSDPRAKNALVDRMVMIRVVQVPAMRDQRSHFFGITVKNLLMLCIYNFNNFFQRMRRFRHAMVWPCEVMILNHFSFLVLE